MHTSKFSVWISVWALLLSSVTPASYAGETVALPEQVRLRNRGIECAIYLSAPSATQELVDGEWKTIKTRNDTTFGRRISGASVDEFSDLMAKKPILEGVVVIAGAPMLSSESRKLKAGVRALLNKSGFENIPVLMITEPKSEKNVRRMVEETVYLAPRPSDVQASVPAEVVGALPVGAGANVSVAFFAFRDLPFHIALSLVSTNSGLDIVAAAFRRSISNWQNRTYLPQARASESVETDEAPALEGRENTNNLETSFAATEGTPLARASSSVVNFMRRMSVKDERIGSRERFQIFLKECALGTVFVAGFYSTSHLDEITGAFKTLGAAALLKTPEAVLNFLVDQAPTIASNGAVFTFLFGGLYLFDKMAKTQEKSDAVRRTQPYLMALLFTVTGPLLYYASQADTAKVLPHLNYGQAGLVAAAAGGALFWKFPGLFDYTIPVVDHAIYRPSEFVIRNVRAFRDWLRQLVGRPAPVVPERRTVIVNDGYLNFEDEPTSSDEVVEIEVVP